MKQIAASASSEESQESGAGTGATRSTTEVSSKLRSSLAPLTAHQVGEIKVSLCLLLPGIDCGKLVMKVDQKKSGPVFYLETALSRPAYPEISAVSLVRKASIQCIAMEHLVFFLT